MRIGGMSGGTPYMQKVPNNGAGEEARLEPQRKNINEQIKRIKEDKQMSPEMKEKKIEELEKRLRALEEKILQARQSKENTGEDTTKEQEV